MPCRALAGLLSFRALGTGVLEVEIVELIGRKLIGGSDKLVAPGLSAFEQTHKFRAFRAYLVVGCNLDKNRGRKCYKSNSSVVWARWPPQSTGQLPPDKEVA